MSKVINRTILKRINEEVDYFSKELLRDYINQMQGQVQHISADRKEQEFQTNYWFNESTKLNTRINTYYKKNIVKRIYLAIVKDIH
jgi:hypothetical protein